MLMLAPANLPADPREIRRAFGAFVTGVTVVTALDALGIPRGLTANSFTSVSLDPPFVLVCIDEKAASHPVFKAAQAFGVSILGATQRATSSLFASKAADKFEQTQTFKTEMGTPLVQGAVSWFDCRTHSVTEVGDHLVLVGRVVAFGYDSGTPLAYCRGNYIDFGLEQDAVGRLQNVIFGCVVDNNGAILLEQDAKAGRWSIPAARSSANGQGPKGLAGLTLSLQRLGAQVDLSFLYSVFEENGETLIVYRGFLTAALDTLAPASRHAALFTANQIRWEEIESPHIRTMLKRYFVERENDRFGVYVDSAEGGRVAMLDGAPTPWSQHAKVLE
jgi:flavin reductase (DIM6/NTAB) family NADH-FMN oxidoreductase RutF